MGGRTGRALGYASSLYSGFFDRAHIRLLFPMRRFFQPYPDSGGPILQRALTAPAFSPSCATSEESHAHVSLFALISGFCRVPRQVGYTFPVA